MGTAPAQCAVCSVRRAACDVQRATRLEHPERGDPIGRDAVIRVALSRRIRSRSPLPRRQPAVDGDPQVARRALSPRRRLEAQVGSQVVLLRGDAAQMLQCTCAGDIPAARSEGPPGHPVGRRDLIISKADVKPASSCPGRAAQSTIGMVVGEFGLAAPRQLVIEELMEHLAIRDR